MRVFVVDDDAITRKMVAHILTRAGHKVVTFANPEQADIQFETFEPDMLVTDWNMPQMSGLDLCERLKTVDKNLAVVVLSSNEQPNDESMALACGADAYLHKPFSAVMLIDAVRHAISQRLLVQALTN